MKTVQRFLSCSDDEIGGFQRWNIVLKGIRRRAATSDHLVELSILEGERSDILVFSNWNGRETAVEFAVRDVPRYREVATVNAALFGVKTGQGVLRGKIRLEGGAVVYCRK